jgi:antitoxin (DNA-binding transcriptional repressor) of toxin-antitoxin stability system
METVTIRELRQNWPAVEKRLAAVGELAVTRDGAAVALLAPPRPVTAKPSAKRFDPAEHARLIRKIWGSEKPSFTTDRSLAEERAERTLGGRSR